MDTSEKELNNSTGRAMKVGIMVISGFAIFLVAIFILGRQQNLFRTTYTLKTVFPGVSGLQVGNNVRFNGINIGTVSDIILFNDTSVMVQMMIEKGMQKFIRKDSRCFIGSEGLMGDKVVTISSGTEEAEVVGDNYILKSDPPIEMDAIIANLKNTVENAEVISTELAMIMFKINQGDGALSRLLSDSTMASDISETLDNLKSSSASLDKNLEAAKRSFLLKGAVRRMEKEEKENKKENSSGNKK